MSLELLNAMHKTSEVLPDIIKPALTGNVQRIADNYFQITGRRYERSFFYRQAGASVTHKPAIRELSNLYFAAAPVSMEKGRLFKSALEICESVVERFAYQKRPRDFWEIEESLSNGMVELRKAKISGDLVRMAIAQNRLEADIRELGRTLAVGMTVRG